MAEEQGGSFCPKCGRKQTEEALFCPGCGTQQPPHQYRPPQQYPPQFSVQPTYVPSQAAAPSVGGAGVEVRNYHAKTQEAAALLFQQDAAQMAQSGYFPVSQSWAQGSWGGGAYLIAALLILLFGFGLLILGYLIIVKPDGTLSVTYQWRQ
jgi:hypothetical protein